MEDPPPWGDSSFLFGAEAPAAIALRRFATPVETPMTDEQHDALIEQLDAIRKLLEAIHERSLTSHTTLGQVRDAIEDNTKTMIRLLEPNAEPLPRAR
jgi:hypothetical protein